MDREHFEKIKNEVLSLESNKIIDEFKANKNCFLNMEDEKIYDNLGKTIVRNFNDDLLDIINNWLEEKEKEECNYIKEFLKEDYFPWIDEIINNLNVSTYDDLVDLSFLLDDQLFYLNKANKNEIKITMYEITSKLVRDLENYELIEETDEKKEQHEMAKRMEKYLPIYIDKHKDLFTSYMKYVHDYIKNHNVKYIDEKSKCFSIFQPKPRERTLSEKIDPEGLWKVPEKTGKKEKTRRNALRELAGQW